MINLLFCKYTPSTHTQMDAHVEANLGIRLLWLEMESVSLVQILPEPVYVSLRAKALEKAWNRKFPHRSKLRRNNMTGLIL